MTLEISLKGRLSSPLLVGQEGGVSYPFKGDKKGRFKSMEVDTEKCLLSRVCPNLTAY